MKKYNIKPYLYLVASIFLNLVYVISNANLIEIKVYDVFNVFMMNIVITLPLYIYMLNTSDERRKHTKYFIYGLLIYLPGLLVKVFDLSIYRFPITFVSLLPSIVLGFIITNFVLDKKVTKEQIAILVISLVLFTARFVDDIPARATIVKVAIGLTFLWIIFRLYEIVLKTKNLKSFIIAIMIFALTIALIKIVPKLFFIKLSNLNNYIVEIIIFLVHLIFTIILKNRGVLLGSYLYWLVFKGQRFIRNFNYFFPSDTDVRIASEIFWILIVLLGGLILKKILGGSKNEK